MGILRAIGFIILLIAIRTLMPDVFFGFEDSLVQFFTPLMRRSRKEPTSKARMPGISYRR